MQNSLIDTESLHVEHHADVLLSDSSHESPQQTIERLRAENARLTAELDLRDRALDSTSTHFTISKHVEPVSIIVYCNRAVAEHHGYKREELVGQPISKITPIDWSKDDYKQVRRRLENGETIRFEHEMRRKDNSTLMVGASVMPLLSDHGRLTHTMSIGADITARLETERKQRELQEQLLSEMKERERIAIELRLAQKLESVGRLAAGVAHEINTPIQFVSDSLHFLRASFDDLSTLISTCRTAAKTLPDGGDIQQFLRIIEAAEASADLDFVLQEVPKAFERTFEGANRVASIVRAMKEFAHPDSSEHSPADINHALRTTLIVASNEYKYVAAMKTDFAELPQVTCNIGELNQVFLNLIVNAAHAIHDAGKNSVDGKISISTALVGDIVEITFTDNGCGIPQEHIDKIYDPFFTTKEVGRGTGQGLAITRSIVNEKHGGDIRVTSTVGVGTQFTLCLPVAGKSVT